MERFFNYGDCSERAETRSNSPLVSRLDFRPCWRRLESLPPPVHDSIGANRLRRRRRVAGHAADALGFGGFHHVERERPEPITHIGIDASQSGV